MTEVVAMIDAQIVGPLSVSKAKALDKKIRAASIEVADNTAALLDLLEAAAVGQIHVALGYDNWAAYIKDAVNISPTNTDERRALVSMMEGKGLSQRAIAAVLGVSKTTVVRDQAESPGPNGPPDTAGVDGKTYKRKEKEPKQKPLDVEVVEEPEPKPQPVSADFKDEMGYLANSVASFNDIMADERFPKARKTIAKNHLNKLQEYIADLHKVVDELMA